MAGKVSEICQLSALKVNVKKIHQQHPTGRSFIMHPHKKGRKEKQTSDASGIHNSSAGMDSTLHDVVYQMVTSPQNWMDFVSDGLLAGAITAQSTKQRGGLKLHFCP